MRLFSRAKDFMRESQDSKTVLSLPRDERRVLVYSEDTFSWIQFEGYLESLMRDHGRKVTYVTSAADDPLHDEHGPLLDVYYVNKLVPNFLPKVDSELFVTTMPDLDSFHVKRPRESTCVYLFHSLNSIHMVYRPGAFDAYDAFFCTGPHHTQELAAHFAATGLPTPELYEVGYHKLDRIHAAHQAYRKTHPDRTTVLLAPSWGPSNLLEAHGLELVGPLVAAGHRVVVRPHPAFFQSIYPAGAGVVDALEQRFGADQNVVIERSIDTEDSFHEADVMISDWSGAAYEYAFATERPVLFVDVPRKVFNPDWEALGITPFEDEMRGRVGRLIGPEEVERVDHHVADLLDGREQYRNALVALRTERVYNFGRAGAAGAEVLETMLS